MGRAIDMEKDIDKLKIQVEKLENIGRGMTHDMDEMSEKSTKTTHIDLVDDVKKEETENGKKEADSKGTSKSNKSDNTGHGNSKKKNPKS